MDCFNREEFGRIRAWQDKLVQDKVLPFTQLLVKKSGEEVYYYQNGMKDIKTKQQISRDTFSRIYSMTKPISSIALMILYEEGKFQLSDPVYLYLGDKWKKSNMKVFEGVGSKADGFPVITSDCKSNVTIRHILTHTSGICYGFDPEGMINPVEGLYYSKGFLSRGSEPNAHYATLADFVDKLAEMPLLYQPGIHFNYGYNVEVAGRLVEVLSGMCYAEFVRQKILRPLKMNSTDFFVSEEDSANFSKLFKHPIAASLRGFAPDNVPLKQIDNTGRQWTEAQTLFKPGEGLVSTIDDYARFCEMLRQGGSLDGQRIISKKTLEFMAMNHLRDADGKECDTLEMQAPRGAEMIAAPGMGFGLGFSVVLDPVRHGNMTSKGSFGWSGMAATHFWIDPVEDLYIVFFTQVLYVDPKLVPIRETISSLVYGLLTESQTAGCCKKSCECGRAKL